MSSYKPSLGSQTDNSFPLAQAGTPFSTDRQTDRCTHTQCMRYSAEILWGVYKQILVDFLHPGVSWPHPPVLWLNNFLCIYGNISQRSSHYFLHTEIVLSSCQMKKLSVAVPKLADVQVCNSQAVNNKRVCSSVSGGILSKGKQRLSSTIWSSCRQTIHWFLIVGIYFRPMTQLSDDISSK